jgi:hypothetical protein
MQVIHRILSLILAFMVFISGLIAAGSIVFEPQKDGVGFCQKRKILVVEGLIPKGDVPDDPVEDSGCSSVSSLVWDRAAEETRPLAPEALSVRMITLEPKPIERFDKVETPPPCA